MAQDVPLRLLGQTFTIPVITALGGTTTTTYAVPGAAVGMGVTVTPRTASSFFPFIYAFVSAANTVSVIYTATLGTNLTASSIMLDLHVIP